MSTASLSFRSIAHIKRGDASFLEVTWRSEMHVKATLRIELDARDPNAMQRSFDDSTAAPHVQLDPESKNCPGPTWLESARSQIREQVSRSGGIVPWITGRLAQQLGTVNATLPRWLAHKVLEHLTIACQELDAEERTMLERHKAEIRNMEERQRAAHERKFMVRDALAGTIHA